MGVHGNQKMKSQPPVLTFLSLKTKFSISSPSSFSLLAIYCLKKPGLPCKKHNPELFDKDGVSVILFMTEKAKVFEEQIKELMQGKDIVLYMQSMHPRNKPILI